MGGCVFQEVRRFLIHYRPRQVSITGVFIHTQVRAVAVILRERQAVLGQRLLKKRRCGVSSAAMTPLKSKIMARIMVWPRSFVS